MKLTRKHVVTGLAATALAAGVLAGGGVALASASQAPAAATAASATPPNGPGAGTCGGAYGRWSGQQPIMQAAADYLGLSLTQLRAQLHSGTSLADIAQARGKPTSGLKDAILAAMTSRINANTTLTAAQKTALIGQFKRGTAGCSGPRIRGSRRRTGSGSGSGTSGRGTAPTGTRRCRRR